MPSQVAHYLFADDAVSGCRHGARLEPLSAPATHRYLVLGAQGPDMFYHNQHRRPTAIAYGSLMHRRGYGTAVARMCGWARRRGLGVESWAGAWIVGFASHAVLDRRTHPFINAHSGWPVPEDPESDQYRSMHPFLERLIDVELLNIRRGIHPNELGFSDLVDCGDEPHPEWLDLMAKSLAGTYRKAASDGLLVQRLRSAYLDTLAYYRHTDRIDEGYLERALAREDAGRIGKRWLSIVHPLDVPEELDVLNRRRTAWAHPCPDGPATTASFLDLYDDAVSEASRMIDRIVEVWTLPEEATRRAVVDAVMDWNLSDGRPTERPCAKQYANPRPLAELQDQIRDSIRAGRGGRLRAARQGTRA
jgi:hypothetical protein